MKSVTSLYRALGHMVEVYRENGPAEDPEPAVIIEADNALREFESEIKELAAGVQEEMTTPLIPRRADRDEAEKQFLATGYKPYIVCIRDTDLWLVGPFLNSAALVEWARGNNPEDDPRWQSIWKRTVNMDRCNETN